MKEAFFTLIALALPLVVFGGILYMFFYGLYQVVSDWQLGRELRQLRQNTQQRPDAASHRSTLDVLSSMSDGPPVAESTGIFTVPLDPAFATSRPQAPPASNQRTRTSETDEATPFSQETRLPSGEAPGGTPAPGEASPSAKPRDAGPAMNFDPD
jgi:hypothetical protein